MGKPTTKHVSDTVLAVSRYDSFNPDMDGKPVAFDGRFGRYQLAVKDYEGGAGRRIEVIHGEHVAGFIDELNIKGTCMESGAYGLDTVVTTVDASMRIEDVAGNVVRSPVGDVYVVEEIRNHSADFGGEPSGTFIFPDIHFFPDGVATAAKAAKLVSDGVFYERLSKIKSYPMTRLKIPCENEKKEVTLKKLESVVTYDYSSVDGIRIGRENTWALLRPSGTEPYFRITAEGRTKKELDGIVGEAKTWLSKAMN